MAKLVRKEPGAEREMLFDGAGKPNVVPILDSGEHGDDYVLIMPKAEKSLRRHLADHDGKLPLAECIQVMTDIATALSGLDGDVVHRDLKPENVLLLNGVWCLADFGIARYAEAATAPDTRKFHATHPYASPEWWRGERATIASDVFTLGVIGFEIFSGSRPFPGPDFRQQVLHDNPPRLVDAPPLYTSLIGACLYRAPQARPTPANLVTRLATLGGPPLTDGLAALAQANSDQVTAIAAAQQQQSRQRTEKERRMDLADAARSSFAQISETVLAQLTAAASEGVVGTGPQGGWIFTFGGATLAMSAVHAVNAQEWAGGAPAQFDVIAYATMALRLPSDHRGYQGRSHSLWFCDARTAEEYSWFETAFMTSPILAMHTNGIEPFALAPDAEARGAIRGDIKQLAWPFTRLEITELAEFMHRWADWLAAAAAGQLTFPSTMPERNTHGSHR